MAGARPKRSDSDSEENYFPSPRHEFFNLALFEDVLRPPSRSSVHARQGRSHKRVSSPRASFWAAG